MRKMVGVIGAGPAGVASSIMLKRYGIDVLLFERRNVGGLLNNAWRVENIPFLQPSAGEDLCHKLKDHLSRNGVELIREDATAIHDRTILTTKASYVVDYSVVATGTMPKRLPALETDAKVVYEFRDIPDGTCAVAVYGAGDMAFDGAIRAKLTGRKTMLFARSKTVRAIDSLRVSAEKTGVELHMAEPILRVDAIDSLLMITTPQDVYYAEVLLVCIGREPALPTIDSQRYEIIGDARGEIYRQASIAVGDGIRTAMRIASQGGES